MEIDFLEDGPAILIEEEKRVLVIADIHMGIESDLHSHGIFFRSQGEERVKRLLKLVKEGSPEIILLLGDVKHRVPGTSWQEFRELPSLFSQIRTHGSLRISPGNHDPGIESFLRKDELMNPEGSILDGIGYMHGHTRPDPSLCGHLIISGHHHPILSLKDQVGTTMRTPCYILGELKPEIFNPLQVQKGLTRVLFIPAFNEFSGYGIEKTFRKPFSPLSRSLVIKTAECLLPDGSYAGELSSFLHYDQSDT